MFSFSELLDDECSVIHDRPTFTGQHSTKLKSHQMTFDEFRALKPNLPESFLLKKYEDIPLFSEKMLYLEVAKNAQREFDVRKRAFYLYTKKIKDENNNLNRVPKVSYYEMDTRLGASDIISEEPVDWTLPDMD